MPHTDGWIQGAKEWSELRRGGQRQLTVEGGNRTGREK